ncbi:MAG: 4-hydroxy-tetrahydrodipicolinate synthase, partial [Rickettsiales bacterium]|nr:4-hydroxy-tetrahydrodipicolinate synthase [Rickettsiales bacterium]
MFKGSIPAVITPFDNESIDYDSLQVHIDFLIKEGSHGLVSCGTTGESPTLDHDEHKKVTEFLVKHSSNKVPVMAGCGSNSTKESIELVHHAKNIGANAALLVSPYYNKPTQEGL